MFSIHPVHNTFFKTSSKRPQRLELLGSFACKSFIIVVYLVFTLSSFHLVACLQTNVPFSLKIREIKLLNVQNTP